MTYHPPPAELNDGPKLLGELTVTPQDALSVSFTSQLFPWLVLSWCDEHTSDRRNRASLFTRSSLETKASYNLWCFVNQEIGVNRSWDEGQTCASVQGNCIRGLIVDPFYDVDFSLMPSQHVNDRTRRKYTPLGQSVPSSYKKLIVSPIYNESLRKDTP